MLPRLLDLDYPQCQRVERPWRVVPTTTATGPFLLRASGHFRAMQDLSRSNSTNTRVGLWTAKTSPLTHQKTATADSNLECLRVAIEQSCVFELDISDADKTKR
jgi:hypothetical protein